VRVVIIDDEKPARQRFRKLLEECQNIEIVGEGENGKEALNLVYELKPDAVFLDIDMPVLSGLEAATALVDSDTMVVFVTAYDQYALNAFDTNAVDYLVKPVEKDRLDRTIERLLERLASASKSNSFSNLINNFSSQNRLTRLAIREGNRFEIVPLSEISMISALDGYAEIYHGEKKSLSDESLDTLEKKLGTDFVRVHRSAIINLDYLIELKREGDRKYTAVLKDYYENTCTVSREALKRLQKRLGLSD